MNHVSLSRMETTRSLNFREHRMKAIAIATAGFIAASFPAYAQSGDAKGAPPAQSANQNAAQTAVQTFVNQAAITNMFEIEAANAAEQKAKDPAYKEFAKMIITDHTKMGDNLKRQVGDISGVKVPASLDQAHQQKLQKLQSESGAQFEKDYRQSQIEGHRMAIRLFQDFAQSGPENQNVDLKSWAKASVPILQKHLQEAENLPAGGQQAGAAASSGATASNTGGATTGKAPTGEQNSAQNLVNEAVQVVRTMEKDQQLANAMKKAKGIYIVPRFGRAAVVVGARGGAGLVTVRQDGKWSDPAFYDFGAISLGPQVGGSGGAVAFLLMSQGAVDAFKSGNKFSLNAEAGLSIVNYSANSQASWGKGDIVMWSDTAGAYIGATVSVTDINWDDERNRQYYGTNADVTKILNGNVSNAGARELISALPG